MSKHTFTASYETTVQVDNPSHIDAAFEAALEARTGVWEIAAVDGNRIEEVDLLAILRDGEQGTHEGRISVDTALEYGYQIYGPNTVGIVDEDCGGIIAYVHEEHAARLCAALELLIQKENEQ